MAAAQVKTLLLIASHLSGYPIPDNVPLPTVGEVSYNEITHDACDDQIPCGVIGFFDFQTGKIEVIDSPDYSEHSVNAIAVHELTHWLQFHNWENPESRQCPREYLREYQAYLAGFKYEVIFEGKKVTEFQTPGVVCEMP